MRDETHIEDRPLIFELELFTYQELPLVWRSLGQFLTIGVDAEQFLPQNTLLRLFAIAIFDILNVETYLSARKDTLIDCPGNATHLTSFSCYSIHTNFLANWNSASQFCHQRGGYLWSVNSDAEWEEVLHPPIIRKISSIKRSLVDKTVFHAVDLINGVKYYRSSSVIYLGLKENEMVSAISVYLNEWIC